MEQMEIFVKGPSLDYGTLKHHVNEWLAKNKGVEITDRQIVLASNHEGTTCVITIYYREKS